MKKMMKQKNTETATSNPAQNELISSGNIRDEQGGLWPSDNYAREVAQLKQAVGKKVFLVELRPSAINMAINLTDKPYELIAVMDFPKPDPEKGNFPHMIVLDDGRGINLGRIARISVNTPFDPPPEHILYLEQDTVHHLLFRKRRLSKASITTRSRALLGMIIGKMTRKPQRLE
jgi:hypothetical protein